MTYHRIEQLLRNPETTLFDALKGAGEKYPDAASMGYFGKTFSFSALMRETESTAKALIQAGVRPGDVVTFMLPNCPQAVSVFYAINRIGAVANMIHTLSSVEEIAYYLNFADSRYMITADRFLPSVKKAAASLSADVTVIYTDISEKMPLPLRIGYALKNKKAPADITADDHFFSLHDLIVKSRAVTLPLVPYEKDKTSVIFYSGGSTGFPKGICLSDYNINSLAIQVADASGYRFGPGMKFLSAMPLFHGFGLGVGIHTFICNGVQCVLVPQFTPDSYVKTLLKEKTNMLAIVPSMLEMFLRSTAFDGKDLSFLQGIFCGADSAPEPLLRRCNAFLAAHGCREQVREGYGLTESVTACILNPKENVRLGSVGLPLGETVCKIVKPGTFEELPAGESGELIIHGPSVMLGYLNDPEETEKTLRIGPDGKKWLFTGDLCRMDEDGYVFFVQRIKRLIIFNGYNIAPTQVERVINEVPGVEKSCVIGIRDRLCGQRVAAYIIPKPEESVEELRRAVQLACRERLAAYAVPTKVVFLDSLPLTKMGKIDYVKLEHDANQTKEG